MFRRFNQSKDEPRRDYKPQGVVAESRKRMMKRKSNSTCSVLEKSDRIPEIVRKKILDFFGSGKYSLSEIARYCGVSRKTVERYLEKDPELKDAYDTLWQERIDRVEQAQVELAESAPDQTGAGVIAAQKAGEFLLRYNRRQRYSETIISSDALKQLPKIVIPIVIPPRDQLPNNPQTEAIDV